MLVTLSDAASGASALSDIFDVGFHSMAGREGGGDTVKGLDLSLGGG